MPQNSLADPQATAANQRGEITAHQREVFADAVKSRGQIQLFYWFLGIFLAGMLIYAAFTAQPPSPTLKFLAYPILGLLAMPGLWAAWRALKFLRRADTARRDMAAGRVKDAVGTIEWTGGHYAAWAPEGDGTHAQRLFASEALNLPPGPYRFHVLASSGWLLSAEPLTAEEAQDQDNLLKLLMATNDLDIEALPVNRAGRLTSRQRAELRRGWWTIALVPAAFAALIGLFMYWVWRAPNPLIATLALTVLAAGLGIGMLILGGREMRRMAADLREGHVATIEGAAQKERVRHLSSREDAFYYRIGPVKFAVSETGYEALIEGRSYRMYYLPHTRRLLSLEPLTTNDVSPRLLISPPAQTGYETRSYA